MCTTKIFMAPMQGFTEAPMRHFHRLVYGALDEYFTPFVRLEHGSPRSKDVRDVNSPLNENHCPTPQIIVRDGNEFDALVKAMLQAGYNEIDINMGCPFTPQVRKGRGAGLLGNADALSDIACRMNDMDNVRFSVKMRLGIKHPDEWRDLMPVINRMPLTHVTVHPRTAAEQYAGELHMDQFGLFMNECEHPLVFNGEINYPGDIDEINTRYSGVHGIMIGRGMLRRPSLAAEWKGGCEWSREARIKHLLMLHEHLMQYAETHLCGDHQVLGKLLPYWDYFGNEFAKKAVKAVIKAKTVEKYKTAVGMLV